MKQIKLIVSKENFKISKNNDSFKIIGKSHLFIEKEEFYKNISQNYNLEILLNFINENIGNYNNYINNLTFMYLVFNIFRYLLEEKDKNLEIYELEIGLHNYYQALILDLIIKLKLKNKLKKDIFIYTRSPAIIDRIGKYIYKKQLNKEDITLKLDNLETKYTSDGGIENYPIKYFSCPELKEFKNE